MTKVAHRIPASSIVGRKMSGNGIRWQPQEGVLPMRRFVTGSRTAALIALPLGSAWSLYFLDLINWSQPCNLLVPDALMLSLVSLPGILVVLYGLSQLVYREQTEINRAGVILRRCGLFGVKAWREPLSAYRGVLKHHQYWRREHGADTMIYSLRLLHDDSAKDVLLYQAENSLYLPPTDWEQKWKAYCRLFHLPAIEENKSGRVVTEVDVLDKPLDMQLREGGITSKSVEGVLRERGVTEERDGDGWLFTLHPFFRKRLFVLFGTFAPGMLVLAWFQGVEPRSLLYWFCAGASFLVLTVLLACLQVRRHRSRPERILVDRGHLWYRHWDRVRKRENTVRLPLAEIIGISVKADPSRPFGGDDIVVHSARQTIRFGKWLPRTTKAALCDRLLARVIDQLKKT